MVIQVAPLGVVDPVTKKKLRVRWRTGTSDAKAGLEIFKRKVYRKPKTNFDVEPGDVWIDIGGHIGLFTLYAISRGAAHVYVYEADEENFKMLEANIKLNNLQGRVTATRAAVVADRELGSRRSIQLYKSRNPNVNYRNSVVPKPRGVAVSVPARRFNAVVRRHPSARAMKIDIEGAEIPILTDPQSFYGKIQKLTFEFTVKGNRLPEAKRVLERKGFVTGIPPSLLEPRDDAWVDYIVHARRQPTTKKGNGSRTPNARPTSGKTKVINKR